MFRWMVLALIPMFLLTGCGDLEPEMQDTRTVILNMDFDQRSSSRTSRVEPYELINYKTQLIMVLTSGKNLSNSNYWDYKDSNQQDSPFGEYVLYDSDREITLNMKDDTKMKIFAFLFSENYSHYERPLDHLFSAKPVAGYYGESQIITIDSLTANITLNPVLGELLEDFDEDDLPPDDEPPDDEFEDIDDELGDIYDGTPDDICDVCTDDIVDPSLEAFYPFNGNAKDITDKYRDLTVYGDTSLTSGKDNSSNSAYYFDGTGDYLEYETNIPSFDNYTISLWAKPDSSGTYEAMFSSYNDSGRGFQIDLDGSNFHIRKSSGGNIVLSTAQLEVWTFIAFTYDGTNSIAYINNESPVSDAGGTTEFNRFRIGMNRAGSAYYKGVIDELRIYNRALTASEISSLYAN